MKDRVSRDLDRFFFMFFGSFLFFFFFFVHGREVDEDKDEVDACNNMKVYHCFVLIFDFQWNVINEFGRTLLSVQIEQLTKEN